MMEVFFMDAYTYFTQELNNTKTENGDKAYVSTGSYCLDLYALIGGMRYHVEDLYTLFLKAYYEDYKLATKILFYARDIKSGLGERRIFRALIHGLGHFHPEIVKNLIPIIQDYGRYDDYFALMDTPVEQDMLEWIKLQLSKDMKAKELNEPISLLAKWMPSINTSSKQTRELAHKVIKALDCTNQDYRKMLAYLRKGLIVENVLREKGLVDDYQTLPVKALFKYKQAWIRNDLTRFTEFISNKAPKKMDALHPYEIVRDVLEQSKVDETTKQFYQKLWDNYPRLELDSSTIVVRDGSGSMFQENAIHIATSLAILTSEMLSGPFKNSFITFGATPQLVKLDKGDIYDKIVTAMTYADCSNTDIKKVFDLILKYAKKTGISQENLPKRILIISDMEFDQGVKGMSSYEYFKTEYAKNGYALPTVVFWNVCARSVHVPVLKEDQVLLVSGASPSIIEKIAQNKSINPYEFMMESLKKYEVIDTLI